MNDKQKTKTYTLGNMFGGWDPMNDLYELQKMAHDLNTKYGNKTV